MKLPIAACWSGLPGCLRLELERWKLWSLFLFLWLTSYSLIFFGLCSGTSSFLWISGVEMRFEEAVVSFLSPMVC